MREKKRGEERRYEKSSVIETNFLNLYMDRQTDRHTETERKINKSSLEHINP